ncbi:MAG TPA: hypothetical protein VF809_00205, partial [Candidatus Saccharimonadales bacterium]
MVLPTSKHRVMPFLVAIFCLLVVATLLVIFGGNDEQKAAAPNLGKHAANAPKASAKTSPPSQYEFPYGGRELLPDYRFVALYGTPDSPKMGVLGEQPVAAAVQRAKDLAAQYQPYSTEKIWPAFEIIVTVASASATNNNDYSNELAVEKIKPWVDAAREAGIYVVLDLQPGRTDFLTQAKMYESLLREPHVGLALDPEWRLGPTQVHMKQIGTVDVAEVNAVGAWLADVTKQNDLPQKMFLLHQFRLSMITNRSLLDTSRKELAYVIQMDGNGGQATKLDTWRNITSGAPAGVYFGWKNFYDEDHPM